MKVFIDTPLCRGGTFCVTCRDREGGRAVRAELVKIRVLPAGDPPEDFACPPERGGKEWGWKPGVTPASPRPSMPLAVVQQRLAICQACEHFTDGKCGELLRQRPGKSCSVNVGVAMAQAHCPLDPPKWERWSPPALSDRTNLTSRGTP